jgi:hypothetical protein
MDLFVPTAVLQAQGIDYRILHQGPGEVIIISPRTYHQGFNSTDNVAEATNYAPSTWLPTSYSFCSEDCRKFFKHKIETDKDFTFTIMNISKDISWTSTLSINPFENVSYSDYFRIQEALGNEKAGAQAVHVIVGGRDAQTMMHIMSRIADRGVLVYLLRILNQTPSSGLPHLSTSDHQTPSITNQETLTELMVRDYITYLTAKLTTFHASLHTRFAALRLARQIKNSYETGLSHRSHKKGHKTVTINDITDQTAINIVRVLTDDQKTLLDGSRMPGDDLNAVVKRDLLELNKMGSQLMPLAEAVGDNVIYVIPHEEFNKYVLLFALFVLLLVLES